jgi:uncharacterized Zn finger protein (UPF0148 family)
MYGSCEDCGSRLACFEGETYCPDCTYYEALELAEEADDEARLLRLTPAPAGAEGEGPADDGPPF